jgi:cell division protein FtsX
MSAGPTVRKRRKRKRKNSDMSSFEIIGGHKLHGTIHPQGAKNEALQVICAVLLTADKVTIENVPDIRDVNKLISLIFLSFIVILIAIAIFLISNTITTGITVRKEEIAIMKLIGAKDSFVRAPFIVEGIAIGLIGSIIPLVILLFMYKSAMIYVTEKFVFLTNFLTFIPVNDIFRVLVPMALVLGIGIGYIGSRMTLKKHLKV